MQRSDRIVAIRGTHDGFAYLGWAGTAEEHRGKGGQNALIKARLNRAAELGCQIACSETLTMLETSLG
ncbi:MAG: GNAT family N-acetyltransferase, partial [Candidatus Poribacteria bacterium]|nr:GNAT family N-acetyltransferase [Candidatus Poribacteria bacterium]